MQEVIERQLNLNEAEYLKNKIESYERKLLSDAFVFSAAILKGLFTAAFITSLAYFTPRYKLSFAQYLFMFIAVGAVLSVLWIKEALRKQGIIEDTIIKYNDVLLVNSVVEQEVQADRYIEIEPEEGYEKYYLFEIVDKKSLLVSAYSTALLFPTTNFSISCILDLKGEVVDYCLIGKEPIVAPYKKVTLKEEVFALIKPDWNMTILECGSDDFEIFLLRQKQTQ